MKKLISVIALIGIAFVALKLLPGFIASRHNLPDQISKNPVKPNAIKNMFGINCYEWDFLINPYSKGDVSHVYGPKLDLVKSFTAIRHYMDWSKIEPVQGSYTFNPTNNGGWNYDAIYEACKQNGIEVLACLKTCPDWLVADFPKNERDAENVPAPYGLSHSEPASYVLQAKAGFQFAARYGYNKNINPALVKVSTKPRWTNDQVNERKIGMGLVKYIECDNERDKWWKGKKSQQTGSEYAANMSAFYDGDKGRLGKDVGIKNADPNMQVVMSGLASANVQFVKDMIAWCEKNRGYKPDGSIDLCFDVINYHFYPNDHKDHVNGHSTRGLAPELSEAGSVADEFVALSNGLKQHPAVWVTEIGYDINQGSPQRAITIGDKSPAETQGDWLLRTVLLFNRHGIKRSFYYQLYDDNNGAIQYSTSGLADGKLLQRRPAADYALQTARLMGDYQYQETVSEDPLVDVYRLGNKKMYILMIPDEKGRTGRYMLKLGKAKNIIVHSLKIGADKMDDTPETTINGNYDMYVTETPIFVEVP